MYISMPVKVYYKYGKKAIRAVAGVGVVPQMFLRFKQNSSWTGPVNNEGKDELKTTKGYNPFVISTVFNLGFEVDFSDKVALFFIPEYKLQLTSSYLKTGSYKHYGRSFGFNIGFTIGI